MIALGPGNDINSSAISQFQRVRSASIALIATLTAEDASVQSMPDASPSKWHLAHSTWFFEQFLLRREPTYQPLHPDWMALFNSYYQSAGPMHPRPERGLLSRPGLTEVLDYRNRIDQRVVQMLARCNDAETAALLALGLNHEQQHQELLLTDIKHAFSVNPLQPAVIDRADPPTASSVIPLDFIAGRAGIVEIGHSGPGFAFDCETPRHRTWLSPHAIANRPVSNGEFAEFIRAGGYQTPACWLAEGWALVCAQNWRHPLYWSDDLDSEFTLCGRRALDPNAPVVHLSFFEADAFARWAGARLPTEAEWEASASGVAPIGNLLDSDDPLASPLHPRAANRDPEIALYQIFGDVWEWTASPYVSYPGFRPLPGALGEYNGKFMCGQWVLRGGSCATPAGHIRVSYRNFFRPADRWQFAGLRLAKDR